jgi:hypothetical protein
VSMQGDQHVTSFAVVVDVDRHPMAQRLEQPPPPRRGHAVATASRGLRRNHDLDALTSHVSA